ncbi:carboxymuconolactone decarboxylase family protein [Algoriphagus sp. Y33]|uniref:carboxymuconolactone decarboxylase family protein n=1 Tax=Algoriphagus sp. Y33 TaxID=2772483 RepID=UPI00177B9240|nr:peroxidase-related enzyme [Algoriphagus sp. Y33]
MTYIHVPDNLPGIRGLMAFRPDTAKHLNQLAEELLRSENSLTRGERELIATHVSYLNDCFYCQHAHQALAGYYLACDFEKLDEIKANPDQANLSGKIKALLKIAGSVQKGGLQVTPDQIEKAKAKGATDREIHDTVLIAAAFCMFNRYVDGQGTEAPQDREFYKNRAEARANEGYANYNPEN